MKPANTKEYFQHLCGHLYDGGGVDCSDGAYNAEEIGFYDMARCPEQYTIIERPMVYVCKGNRDRRLTSITSEQLTACHESIEVYLTNMDYTLICSFPIEEQK